MAANYLDGVLFAPSKNNAIANKSSEQDSMMVGSTCSRYTTMCMSLMVRPGKTRSTSLRPGSHVNLSPSQESNKRHEMIGTDGQEQRKSSVSANHPLSFSKTSQVLQLDLMDILERFSLTYGKGGMMRSGELSALTPLEHPISETVFGYSHSNHERWPTPLTNDARNSTLPPSAAKRKGSLPGAMIRQGYSGELNPSWVEHLMGWPIGATDCEPLVMDRFLHPWWARFAPCSTTPLKQCEVEE